MCRSPKLCLKNSSKTDFSENFGPVRRPSRQQNAKWGFPSTTDQNSKGVHKVRNVGDHWPKPRSCWVMFRRENAITLKEGDSWQHQNVRPINKRDIQYALHESVSPKMKFPMCASLLCSMFSKSCMFLLHVRLAGKDGKPLLWVLDTSISGGFSSSDSIDGTNTDYE